MIATHSAPEAAMPSLLPRRPAPFAVTPAIAAGMNGPAAHAVCGLASRLMLLCIAVLLGLMPAPAQAQSLPHGVSIDGLQAVRDTTTGSTLITGALHNRTGRLLNSASVVFTLQDAQGNTVGHASDITYNLADGATWQVRATAAQPFVRFSAYEVEVQ